MAGVRTTLLAASFALLTVACTGGEEANTPLLDQVRQEGSLAVIVTLAVSPEKQQIAQAQTALLDELGKFDVRNVRRFTYTPLLALVVDEPALRHLLGSPRVAAIQEDTADPSHG